METDQLHVLRLNKILPLLKETIEWIEPEDKKIIDSIINKYTHRVNNYSKKNLKIINPKRSEIGNVKGNLKKIVYGAYLLPLKKERPSIQNNIKYIRLFRKLSDACDKTKITEEVMASRILLSRRINQGPWRKQTDLEKALSEQIKILMLRDFQNQNQEFIQQILKIKL